jgi:hypothetical protein
MLQGVVAVDSAIPPDDGVTKPSVEATIPPRLGVVVLAADSRNLPWPDIGSDEDGLSYVGWQNHHTQWRIWGQPLSWLCLVETFGCSRSPHFLHRLCLLN